MLPHISTGKWMLLHVSKNSVHNHDHIFYKEKNLPKCVTLIEISRSASQNMLFFQM